MKYTHNNMDSKNINNDFNTFMEEPWNIIETYFENRHLEQLVRHQLESYNDFVNFQIQKTIDMFNPVSVKSEQFYNKKLNKHSLEGHITFQNFNIYRPQIHENNGATKLMFPQEARLRNFTYASNMTIDMNIKYIVRTGKDLENCQTIMKNIPKIHIGKLPIMLKSSICVLKQYNHLNHETNGECAFDAGGYFIINGSEKTVLGQERAAENRIYCFDGKNTTKFEEKFKKCTSRCNFLSPSKVGRKPKLATPKYLSDFTAKTPLNGGRLCFIWIFAVGKPISLPLFSP